MRHCEDEMWIGFETRLGDGWVEWDGQRLTPISAYAEGQLVALTENG